MTIPTPRPLADIIKEMNVPCYQSFFDDIRTKIENIEKMEKDVRDEERKDFRKDILSGVLASIILGPTQFFIDSPNDVEMEGNKLKYVKSIRGIELLGGPPCNLNMRRSVYNGLSEEEKTTVQERYSMFGRDSYIVEDTAPTLGGTRGRGKSSRYTRRKF